MKRAMVTVMVAIWTVALVVPARAESRTVELQAETFSPSGVTVSQGDSVTFVWRVGFHNVVFDDGASSGSPTGDVGTTYSRTFTSLGTFPFVCETHESVGMVGTVTVLAASTSGDGDDGAGTDSVVSGYPDTGPDAPIMQAIGFALLAVGAAGWIVATRRRRVR